MTAYQLVAKPTGFGRNRRRALLASTAFAGGILAALAASPRSAFADCIANGTTTVTVDCAANTTTTNTTNTTSTNTSTLDRYQVFDANLVGTIHSGVTIDTFGLALLATGTTAHTIDMTNSGTVNFNQAAASGAVNLTGNGGTVTYGGAGAVNGNSFVTAVVLTNTAGGNIVFNGTGTLAAAQGGLLAITSGSGTITATIANDITSGSSSSAVSTTTADGLNTVNMTAGTIIGSAGVAVGINASSTTTGGVRVNMTGGQIGTALAPVGLGILATTNGSSGDVFVTGGTIFAKDTGISAVGQSFGDNGNIRVDVAGTITATSAPSNPGDAAVLAGTLGNGTVTVNVNSAVTSINGIGVYSYSAGNGAVTVNVGADIGASSGVTIQGPPHQGVVVSGTNGLTTVNMTAGTISAGGDGLVVSSSGTGGVKVNMTGGQIGAMGLFGPTVGGSGIVASTTGASGNVDVTAGTINSVGDGIVATINNNSNNGTVTVTANGAITTSNSLNTAGIYVMSGFPSGSQHVTVNNAVTGGVAGVWFNFGTSNTLTVSSGGSITTWRGLSGDAIFVNGSNGTGSTAISNGGTITGNVLAVNGSSFSNETTGLYNSGATFDLRGNFTNKGSFAPGGVGTLAATTLTGSFSQTASGKYLVDVSPFTADITVVTGSAKLGGTVQATFGAFGGGTFVARSYKILNAASLSGTFSDLSTVNLPTGFSAKLAYTATDVDLLLSLGLANGGASAGQPSQFGGFNLNLNQNNVATTIDNSFNTTGVLNAAFTSLVNLPAGAIPTALSNLSGEIGTGAATASSQAMGQFLETMLDPFVDGRDVYGVSGGTAMAYAPEPPMPDVVAAAVPSIAKAPPAESFERRWSVWGAGFGGQGSFAGNASVGSNNLTARTGGLVAGFDRRLGPDTLVGMALAGHFVSYGLAGGMGSGGGDGVQAGLYASQRLGAAYLSAAAAYSWQDLSTDRTVLVGAVNDHLTAKFQAQGVGGRIEAGYRVAVFDEFGVTPYAAGQAQSLRLPSYSETDASGLAAFALSYGAKTTTDSRSELGARFDTRFMTGDQSRLILRARAAWAHDFSAGPSANATFQTLPGFGFTVFGAAPDRDSALTSASAEYKLGNGVSFLAKFDGQFGDTTRVYAGTGAVRVAW